MDGLTGLERKNARNHNIAVLSACLFPEAVISLLMKANTYTVKALGLHLGYLSRKSKGSKKSIVDAFTAELFRLRNRNISHAAAPAAVKSLPWTIPDNVKLSTNNKRQICFFFTD